MIDILLVLLIIFMVIVPVTPKGLDALVPQPPKDPQQQQQPNDRTIVVQVLYRPARPGVQDQRDGCGQGRFAAQADRDLRQPRRARHVRQGRRRSDFAYVAEVIDIGRAANVDHIGLMTPKIHGWPVAGCVAGLSPAEGGCAGCSVMRSRQQRLVRFRLANWGPGGWNRISPFSRVASPVGGGSSGRKQEYNFSILVSVLPPAASCNLRFQARTDRRSPEGEGYEHEWTRTYYGARGCLGRHGAFHERVQPPAARDQLNKGVEAYKSAHYEEAIGHFQKATQLDPTPAHGEELSGHRAGAERGARTGYAGQPEDRAAGHRHLPGGSGQGPHDVNSLKQIAGIYSASRSWTTPRPGRRRFWPRIPRIPRRPTRLA
jgi:biopolymer transport protein TolR